MLKIRKDGFTPPPVKPRYLERGAGFTLPELILAAAILAFVLCSLLVLFATCIFLNDANRNVTVAISHAQDLMEDMKNSLMASESINTLSSSIDSSSWNWDNAAVQSTFGAALPNEYTSVSWTTDPLVPDALDTVVTVYWQDRRQRNRSFSLETLFTEP